MASVRSTIDIALLGFLTNTVAKDVYFIVDYQIYLRKRKKRIEYLYFNDYLANFLTSNLITYKFQNNS